MTALPDSPLMISIDRRGPHALVAVEGELDMATAPKLARAVDGQDGARRLPPEPRLPA